MLEKMTSNYDIFLRMLKKEKEVDTLYTIDLYALCIDDHFREGILPTVLSY